MANFRLRENMPNIYLLEDFYSNYTNNSLNSAIRKETTQLKMANDLNGHLTKGDKQMENMHMRRCST